MISRCRFSLQLYSQNDDFGRCANEGWRSIETEREREKENVYCLSPILSGYWLEADKKGALELIGLEVVVADNIWTEPRHLRIAWNRPLPSGITGKAAKRDHLGSILWIGCCWILNIQTLLSNQVAPQPTWSWLEIGVWGIGRRGGGGGFGLCSRGSPRSFGRELGGERFGARRLGADTRHFPLPDPTSDTQS